MAVVLTILTIIFGGSTTFINSMGAVSAFIEAFLGVPQLILNFKRKSTQGLEPLLIAGWLFGDSFKAGYYITKNAPIQLVVCGFF